MDHLLEPLDVSAQHLKLFWMTSRHFWQSSWHKLLDITGDDPKTLWMYGTFVLTLVLYWFVGMIFVIMDVTNKPEFLRKYKTQPGTNEPVDKKKLFQVIRQVLFNQTVVIIPFGICLYPFVEWRGMSVASNIRTLPTFQKIMFDIFCCILLEEIGFYYTHRIGHLKFLYKHFHKRHHEWTAPIAITALYQHPLDYLFSGIGPVVIAPLIMGCHISTTWLWFTIATINVLNDHSGYHFPIAHSPEMHDFHHLKFTNCYGVLGVLDWLHGTDKMFRESKMYARDKILLSSRSMIEIHPERRD